MSAFHNLVPVDTTSSELLVALARAVWPVVVIEGGAQFLDPRDIVNQSYTFNEIPIADAYGLEAVGELTTFHSFGAPVFFKPSAAEVLLQIWHPIEQLKAEGKQVVAYDIMFDARREHAFHHIGDPLASPDLAKGERGGQTVHKAQVMLYSGQLPEELKTRPILCRKQIFAPSPTFSPT